VICLEYFSVTQVHTHVHTDRHTDRQIDTTIEAVSEIENHMHKPIERYREISRIWRISYTYTLYRREEQIKQSTDIYTWHL